MNTISSGETNVLNVRIFVWFVIFKQIVIVVNISNVTEQ